MRSSRFILLATRGCRARRMHAIGGPGLFARNAPPLWQQNIVLPAMLRPGAGPPSRRSRVIAAADRWRSRSMRRSRWRRKPSRWSRRRIRYTLDSGDKLRVVVFGQDGLSASYSVDTSGNITMPLIGAVARAA